MRAIVGTTPSGDVFMILLAIAAFPPACFSAFIAANSFKTTMPKVNPVRLGRIGHAGVHHPGRHRVTRKGQLRCSSVIGASFGPVCGAMAADYLLAGKRWAGPRAGFNPAGWISWIVGFAVGAADFIPQTRGMVPAPPVAAFVVGFVLYWLLSMDRSAEPHAGDAGRVRSGRATAGHGIVRGGHSMQWAGTAFPARAFLFPVIAS